MLIVPKTLSFSPPLCLATFTCPFLVPNRTCAIPCAQPHMCHPVPKGVRFSLRDRRPGPAYSSPEASAAQHPGPQRPPEYKGSPDAATHAAPAWLPPGSARARSPCAAGRTHTSAWSPPAGARAHAGAGDATPTWLPPGSAHACGGSAADGCGAPASPASRLLHAAMGAAGRGGLPTPHAYASTPEPVPEPYPGVLPVRLRRNAVPFEVGMRIGGAWDARVSTCSQRLESSL